MGEIHTAANAGPGLAESGTFGQQEILEQAVTKLVLLGKQVGVSADQMIQLLESGLTVVELVEYLAAPERPVPLRLRSDPAVFGRLPPIQSDS